MKNQKKLKFQLKNPLKNWSKKRKLLICLTTLLAVVAISTLIFFNTQKNKREERMSSSFITETAVIERQTLSNSISATGTIESAETKTVNTKMSNMEILSVHVKEGDYVEEGTVICEFDSSDYEEELAKAKNNQTVNEKLNALGDDYTTIYNNAIEKAEEGLADVRAVRDEAKEAYIEAIEEHADEESDVSGARNTYEEYIAKHPAAEEDLKKAQGEYESAQTAVTSLEQELYKHSDDPDTAATLNEQLTAAKTNLETAKAAYDEANRIVNKMQGYKTAYQQEEAELKAAEQVLEQTKAQYEQAQSQREDYQTQYEDSIKKAQEDYDRAVLEEQLITETQEEKTIHEYTDLIEDCVVKAAMSGVITSLNVTEGNNFEGGDIYTIQDNEHFIVSATVDEYDISSIKKGMTAYVKTDATGDAEMNGEVTYVAIAPSSTGGAMGAISSSASYRIEITISNPDENLRAGMTAKLSISLEESADALTVPYDAVTSTPDGKSSITADVNGEKKTITVETGLETDYYTEIISEEIYEGMTVYLSSPMITSTPDSDDMFEFPGGMENMMPGGDMPSDMPDRGGMPSGGGMPDRGGPGGF